MIRKFAKSEILDVRHSPTKVDSMEGFSKLAKPDPITEDGYLYVTVRAISSRVNKNQDGWPSLELARSDPGYGYKTFEGRPIFVDHNNDDPDRTRGVVVSSTLHVDDEKKASSFDPYYANAPEEHLPPTWIELMLEVDAKEYPKLAKNIIDGHIDSVSMGANIELSKCSVCGHEAENPTQYCSHVKQKGATFEITADDGSKAHKLAYEDCYGINFFEISFVFDPADETALISDMSAERKAALQAIAALESAGAPVPQELRKQAAGPPPFNQDDPDDPRGEIPGEHEQDLHGEEEQMPEEPELQGPDESEDQKVFKWNMHLLVDEMSMTPEAAETFLAQGGDPHDLEAFLQQYPKADADTAARIVASVDKKSSSECDNCGHSISDHKDNDEECEVPGCSCSRFESDEMREGKKEAIDAGDTPGMDCDYCGHAKSEHGEVGCSKCNCGGYKSPKASKKEAIGPPGKEHHNLNDHRNEVERERQLNHEPQADKMTAPDEVDTLRPEIICKKCGSTVEPDSAGQLICQECGYEVEPEGLDNPDLEMARDIDVRQDKTEEVNPEGEMETELEHDKGETEMPTKAPSKSPVRPVAPISSTHNDPVRDEMKFSEVQKRLGHPNPDMVRGVVAFMEGMNVEVEDEVELARIVSEADNFKGEPTIYDTAAAIEVVASKTAAAQDNADSKTDVKVNTDKKRPNNSAATQSASEKVISDQLAPVESNTKFEVLAETESEETSNEDTTMAEETKTADRETIKRVEEDGSGVKRTEEITKEFGPMAESGEPVEGEEGAPEESEEAEGEVAEGEEESPPADLPGGEGDDQEVKAEGEESDDSTEHNPLNEEEKVPAMASADEKGKLMAALKLAKKAASLGVIDPEEELEFAGELESSESLAEIEARSKMLERVEASGLKRTRRPVVASRFPSLQSTSSYSSDVDDADDEALFL